MRTITAALILSACACLGQEYSPRFTPIQGYEVHRVNNPKDGVVLCWKWTASEQWCSYRVTQMKTWNNPTNAAVIPLSATVCEKWYYKDPATRLFTCFTNIQMAYAGGKWSTNFVPTWPEKISEAPISLHGVIKVNGTNGTQEISEGDAVYRIDASRCTRPWYVIVNFRTSPVSPLADESYLEYCTALIGAGDVKTWSPNMAVIKSQAGYSLVYMRRRGYAPTQVRPTRFGTGNFVMDIEKKLIFTNTEN
jgi:hypothetical protein